MIKRYKSPAQRRRERTWYIPGVGNNDNPEIRNILTDTISITIMKLKRGDYGVRYRGRHKNNWIQIFESELKRRGVLPHINNTKIYKELYKIY